MKKIFLICSLLALSANADESILLQRIVALETRLAELEQKLAPVLEEERVKEIVKQQKALARERMMLDAEFLSRSDLRNIEKLYQTANADWKSEEAKKSLELLIANYPKANRTGCAVLYLGQMTKGAEQLKYLNSAIENYGDCYYGNGVNVGAYARLYLAMRYNKEGKTEAAEKLFEQIRTSYPDAVDHKGQLLTTHLEDLN
ncbi:tetratricopeptide repeat protein [Pontiellaceae bacterium B12219]|nr:tetratricopeptide repeat protein [Pontiellaceae bacterium B12219]